ncbi:MAG TPA: YidC/Oxa1 family membrane protein insertase [Candidatus Dormibacteraeota bacterium]|nr:YidC/Oxa1 family membrane protein insertase [Candidatus Dormibacteraeota bacterium]
MTRLADGAADAVNPFAWISAVYRALAPPIQWGLEHLESAFAGVGPLSTIGAFGLAIIAVTLIIRILLFPLYQWQLKTTRRIQAEQRRIAPQMQALRRKHKGDSRTLQAEMMKLYKEHDISPLSQMSGCLPLLIQLPILGGLYNGIRDASAHVESTHFLWIHDLNQAAKDAAGDLSPGALLTHPWVLIVPAIAAAATFVQTKITIAPPRPNMSDQERQMYSVSRNMAFIAPGMVLLFGLLFPQGLAIYWATQSVVMIAQQWYLLGWGGLKVPAWFPGAGRVTKLSYSQRADEVVEEIKHHQASGAKEPKANMPRQSRPRQGPARPRTGDTKLVKPAGESPNGKPAAGANGSGPASRGGTRTESAGDRPPAVRRPPQARGNSSARGGRRRRGR